MPSYEQDVTGIKPPDAEWQKMKDAWEACEKAGINPPPEVMAFFGGEPPDPLGVTIDLTSGRTPHPCASEYSEEMRTGWEIDLTKLPPGVKVLRFTHSYD